MSAISFAYSRSASAVERWPAHFSHWQARRLHARNRQPAVWEEFAIKANLKRKTVKQTANATSRFIDAERPGQRCLSSFRNCENVASIIKRMEDGGTRSFRYERGMPGEGDAQAVW